MSQVNTEIGSGSPTSALTMNDGRIRALAGTGTSSGQAISMGQLRGRSSYTAMSASGYGDSYYYDLGGQQGVQYTHNLYPTLNLSGGSGGYTYLWEFTANIGAYTMANSTSSQCTIQHVISKFGFTGSCTVRVTITDNTGHQVVVDGFEFYIEVA